MASKTYASEQLTENANKLSSMRAKLDALTAKYETLRAAVTAEMIEEDLSKLVTDNGLITLCQGKTTKEFFPEAVVEMKVLKEKLVKEHKYEDKTGDPYITVNVV